VGQDITGVKKAT